MAWLIKFVVLYVGTIYPLNFTAWEQYRSPWHKTKIVSMTADEMFQGIFMADPIPTISIPLVSLFHYFTVEKGEEG